MRAAWLNLLLRAVPRLSKVHLLPLGHSGMGTGDTGDTGDKGDWPTSSVFRFASADKQAERKKAPSWRWSDQISMCENSHGFQMVGFMLRHKERVWSDSEGAGEDQRRARALSP